MLFHTSVLTLFIATPLSPKHALSPKENLDEDDAEEAQAGGRDRIKARKFKLLLEYDQVPEYIATEYKQVP